MKRNFLKACAFLCVFYLLSTPNSISFPHMKGFRVSQPTPDIFLFAVYYDVKYPPSQEKLQKILDRGEKEFKTKTDTEILFSKPQPMQVVAGSNLDEILMRARMRNSIIKWDGHLFVSDRTEIAAETEGTEYVPHFGGWEKKVGDTKRWYGLCKKDAKVMGLYDINLQIGTKNLGGITIALCSLMHELFHFYGVGHNDSENSIMFENSDKNYGNVLPNDLEALQVRKMFR